MLAICIIKPVVDALAVVASKTIHYFPDVETWKTTLFAKNGHETPKTASQD